MPRLLGWPRQRIRERVGELLELVGLDPEKDRKRFPAELSGGQRQRVGLARALAANPALMLMDEPFGAIDPIVRARLQDEFLRLQQELRKTVVFVTHDIDEAIKVGDRIAILREGGRLAQYDTPQQILEHPVDEFVADFVGRDRALKALTLKTVGELELSPATEDGLPRLPADTSLRDALAVARRRAPRRAARRRSRRIPARRRKARGPAAMTGLRLAERPGHPELRPAERLPAGTTIGSAPSWVHEHWGDTLQPALIQHIELTLMAVGIGFVIAFVLALVAFRFAVPRPAAGRGHRLPLLHPEHRALPAARAGYRASTVTTVEIALVAYTLFVLYRNIVAGLRSVPPDVLESARGMGLTRRQTFLRVELPLAMPAIWPACGSRRSRRSRSPPSPPSSSRTVSELRSSPRIGTPDSSGPSWSPPVGWRSCSR